MNNNKKQYIRVIYSLIFFAGVTLSVNLRAEFVLDWAADNASPAFSGTSVVHGGTNIAGQTDFIYERVTDPGSGTPYYHMVVGTPGDGFAQEVYILVGGPCGGCQVFNGIGSNGSPSLGGTSEITGNGTDPLSNTTSISGNSTGNPTRIQMREIHNDGEFSMDFTKNAYLEKPSMSMNITSADFQSEFVIDSSGILYNDNTTTAVVTNIVQIIDPDDGPVSSGSFDMSSDVQDSFVSAGRYTYTPGAGTGAGGTYTYTDDTFDLSNVNWADYFDTSVINPWAFTANHP